MGKFNFRDPMTWLMLGAGVLLIVTGISYWQSLQPSYNEPGPPKMVSETPPSHAEQTLQALLSAEPPARDLVDLAHRFHGLDIAVVAATDQPAQGDTLTFWFKDQNQNDKNVQIEAVLRYRSDDLNFWVEKGAGEKDADIFEAAQIIENDILPTTRAFFGEERRPGIDGDNRVNILHLKEIGGSGQGTVTAGYFSAADSYPKAINEFSNEREMLYISLKQPTLGSNDYYEVIAHEFEHMIQWNTDLNEAGWMDEGLAELSASVNGYYGVDSVNFLALIPDTQLNNFEPNGNEGLAHYGASYLFNQYFLDRFGEEATKMLVQAPENGVQGVNATLAALGVDAMFDDFFSEWLVANYLASRDLTHPLNVYKNVDFPEMQLSADIKKYPTSDEEGLHQYAADYIRLRNKEPLTFHFEGSQQAQLLKTTPHSGDFFWTTLPVDRSDLTLTRAFDLSGVETATLQFWSWYRIEEDWDYGYVAVSGDDGDTWTTLTTDLTTDTNPQGNNYGNGLTGSSDWVQQTADLTPWAGQPVLVRFEYITDDAVTEQGWAIDDITIPEIGFSDDFESADSAWGAAGFVRHGNILHQSFILQVIYIGKDGSVQVEQLPLTGTQGDFELALSSSVPEAVVVISANTPVTTRRTAYEYSITR